MEAISPRRTRREHRGADYPRPLRSPLRVGPKSWFSRREPAKLPDLEYRTCATSSRADAKAAAERMIGRRETYMSGADCLEKKVSFRGASKTRTRNPIH